ncbi:MAG: ABC transporter substrate-binding protein, partial [Gammaproteobacteria bacterium]
LITFCWIAQALQAQPIKVGLVVPLSGPWARQGQVMRAAAELAVEQINAGGGIIAHGGRPLELVVYDTGDSVERAKNAAQRMVAQEEGLVGATGSYLSSFTLAVTEVTERAQIPMLTLSYSDLITSRGYDYVFQTSATGAYQSENSLPLLLDIAEQASGKRPETIGIVMDNTAASVAFVSPIVEGSALADNNLELVVNEVFTPPLANATPLIQRVRSRRPDLLLLLPTAISDTKLLLEKMNEFGLGRGRLPTISNGAAMGSPDLAANMPPQLLEGVMSIVANWSTSGQEAMIQEYMRFSGEPWMTQNPLCAFGHIWLLKEALELAETPDSVAVNTALHSMDITTGASDYFAGERVRFDETGKRIDAEILVIQWQGGKPYTVYPDRDAMSDLVWPSR